MIFITKNLFILRGNVNHAKYLNEQLWITFHDIENSFDSLWLQGCIIALWRCGVRYDIICLLFELKRKVNIIVKTPVPNAQRNLLQKHS